MSSKITLPPPTFPNGLTLSPPPGQLFTEIHVELKSMLPFSVIDSKFGPDHYGVQLNVGGTDLLQVFANTGPANLTAEAVQVPVNTIVWTSPDSLSLQRKFFSEPTESLQFHLRWEPDGTAMFTFSIWDYLGLVAFWGGHTGSSVLRDFAGFGIVGYGNGSEADFTNAEFRFDLRYGGITNPLFNGGAGSTQETSNLTWGIGTRAPWGTGEKLTVIGASKDLLV